MPQANVSPIPVNIITGALGAGKTTAIARLLADKPAHESWLVILNEFTDTGIDTLTLAAAARGAYDVRMIPGGCLCCTGEEDFRRQLSGLLASAPEQWPARILIEPSGIGHTGAIVDELRLFERGGYLKLHSTVALLDGQRSVDASTLGEVSRAQIDAADVLLLSKAEGLGEQRREQFLQWAQGLFPAKRWVACIERGVLPVQALSPPAAAFSFELIRPNAPTTENTLRPRSAGHADRSEHHELAPQAIARQVLMGRATVRAKALRLIGREACGWMIPASVLFDRSQVLALLADTECWRGVERFKAVLRIGVDQWCLVQRWEQQHAVTDCNWSMDSRIEIQMAAGATAEWQWWDARWQSLSEACPVG